MNCDYCGGPPVDGRAHIIHDCTAFMKLQVSEMTELLRQANDLYTGYGLICGPIKGFPKYEGKVHQGEWIGKVRAILRATEKPKSDTPEGGK